MPQVGQILHETYCLGHKLGAGAAGEVYEATHLRLPRRFAIKFLTARHLFHSEMVSRFQREAKVMSQLGHPNVVEVVDFNSTSDGVPYIVMELLEGENLKVRLQREGPLELQTVCSFVQQLGSALQAAHDQGLVHRDLKPENLFIVSAGKAEVLKVLDFGVSKVIAEAGELTMAGSVIGTPWYMSPEQVQGESGKVTHQADIFAVGVLLFEMLAGRVPFQGVDRGEVFRHIAFSDPPLLRSLRPDLPQQLGDVVRRALSKNQLDRQDSMQRLVDEFVAAADLAATGPPPRPSMALSVLASDPRATEARPVDAGLRVAASDLELAATMTPTEASRSDSSSLPGRSAAASDLELAATMTPTEASRSDSSSLLGRKAAARRSEARMVIGPDEPTMDFAQGSTPRFAPTTDSTQVSTARFGPRPWLAWVAVGSMGFILLGAAFTLTSYIAGSPSTPVPEFRSDGSRYPEPQQSAAAPHEDAAGDHQEREDASPLADSTARARPAAVSKPRRVPGRRPVTPPRRPTQRFGWLTVVTTNAESEIWANILLDGKPLGRSIIYRQRVSEGRHRVEARRRGYQPAFRDVRVRPRRELRISLLLRR